MFLHDVKTEKIAMVHMGAEFIEAFCQYQIQKRGCSSDTVNNGLAAVKSLLKLRSNRHRNKAIQLENLS